MENSISPSKSQQTLKFSSFLISLFITFIITVPHAFAEQNDKIPSKPVEPFYQEIPADESFFYEPQVTYLSPEKDAPISFSSIGATWEQFLPDQTSILLEIRLKNKGKFSSWYQLEPSIDEFNISDNSKVSSFLTTNIADGYQYRVTLKSQENSKTPIFDNLKFTFINGGSPSEKTSLLIASKENNTISEPKINFEKVPNPNNSVVKSTTQVSQAESITVFPDSVKKTIKVPVKTNINNSINNSNIGVGTSVTASGLEIITRAEWGADESLRLYKGGQKEPELVKLPDDYYTRFASELQESLRVDADQNGNQLTWPLSYPKEIKKIVIHHTSSTKNLDDPQKAIRDIYAWHTLSRGWGDIGYNYIIDQQGNIYEGRFGGEMVVGAHSGTGNFGSIGIALLGNYQDNEPPEAVLNALVKLIKNKAQLYNIDTTGSSMFRGEFTYNILGHKDFMSTACPGEKLYDLIPLIRELSKVSTVSTANTAKSSLFAWNSDIPPIISINPNSKKMGNLTIKNISNQVLDRNIYFKVKNNQNAKTFLKNSGNILTGILAKDLQPGESATIQVLLNTTITSGSGLIELQPIINGSLQEGSIAFGLKVNTPPPKVKYDYKLMSVIYSKETLNKGDIVTATVKLRNTGIQPWLNTGENKVTLGADMPRDHQNNLLVNPSNRYATLQESRVASGEIGTFTFQIKVPEKDGVYKEYFTPVVEGIQWMNNNESYIQIQVGNSSNNNTNIPTSSPAPTPAPTPATINPTPTGSNTINIAATALNTNIYLRPIRIDLSYRGNPATIASTGPYSLYQGTVKIVDLNANQKATVKYENNTFVVNIDNSKTYNISAKPRFIPAPNSILRIDNWNRQTTSNLNYNQFRGVLEAILYDGELHFVNELPMEDYLRGLAEENDREPVEKIKAMQIIARTYARFYMDVAKKFPGAPFDLNDDPQYSQKYLGYVYEINMPLTVAQVKATEAMYVTYQGKLIKTPYFSRSNGKTTISAKDKWGWTDTPFLQSVDDSFCNSNEYAGHGVGLSGCGANALANKGYTYDQIIKHYYSGVEITKSAN